MKPNWLDRAILAVAPRAGERRIAARQRVDRMATTRALYEGASISRRTQGWRATGTDANTETRHAIGRLRNVARDMVRNNGYAARAKTVIQHNVVGTGILPQVTADSERRAAAVKKLLKQHFESTDIDADGRHNLYGLQDLAIGTIVEAGEVLIRMRPRRAEDKLALPFQLQVLEPDFIDSSVEGVLSNGNIAVQGVEFDLIGRRVAYYLFDQHPGSMLPGVRSGFRGTRVSADFVAHVFRVDRPGQVRGVSWFAPVMTLMRDWADYRDAQLIRQKIAACFAAFVTTEDDGVDPGAVTETQDPENGYQYAATSPSGIPVEQFEPGMIERLRQGESVEFATPPTTQDFAPYASETLGEAAVGLGISREAFTGNLSGVNYSSGRMGWLEFGRNIESWRWNMLIPQMLGAVDRWTHQAVAVVTGSTEPWSLTWTPPRREMIDPSVEIDAAKKAIRTGLSSRSEEQRRLGYSPEELAAEQARDNEVADKNGLIFDSDPRRVTDKGVSQKIADPNAPDIPDIATAA